MSSISWPRSPTGCRPTHPQEWPSRSSPGPQPPTSDEQRSTQDGAELPIVTNSWTKACMKELDRCRPAHSEIGQLRNAEHFFMRHGDHVGIENAGGSRRRPVMMITGIPAHAPTRIPSADSRVSDEHSDGYPFPTIGRRSRYRLERKPTNRRRVYRLDVVATDGMAAA